MVAMKRVNNADTTTDEEMAKIKKEHDKQLKKKFSQEEMIWGMVAYVGPLFVFPLLMKQTSAFVQFHAKQGMLLFGVEAIFFLGSIIPFVGVVFKWLTLVIFLGGAVVGIMNVIKEKMETLPLIGKYGENE